METASNDSRDVLLRGTYFKILSLTLLGALPFIMTVIFGLVLLFDDHMSKVDRQGLLIAFVLTLMSATMTAMALLCYLLPSAKPKNIATDDMMEMEELQANN